jgi:hypothetical protein
MGTDARARARGAVLWGAFCFAGLTVAFIPLAERQPQLRDAEFGARLRLLQNQLQSKPPDQPCVVAFGSSLTAMGFNPAALTTVRPAGQGGPVVFNYGVPNSLGVAQLLALRRLLAAGVRPDLVLIETQCRSFCTGANLFGTETYYPVLRLQARDLPVLYRYDPDADAVVDRWVGLQWCPWGSYRRNLQFYYLPRSFPLSVQREMSWRFIDRNGWLVLPHCLDGTRAWSHEQKCASPRYWARGVSSSPCSESLVRAHREIVATCRQAGVRVMVVRVPEHSIIVTELEHKLQDQIDRIVADLGRETGEPVVDARNWIPDGEFYDGTHLSPNGSVQFTRRLEKEALEPRLFRRASPTSP